MDWMQWVLPASVKMMLLGWNGSFVGKKRKEVWRAGPLCIFWTVLEGKKQNCIWRWCAVHSNTWEFFYLFSLVRDEIVHQRWSSVFSRFHWLGGFSLRVVFFGLSALQSFFCPIRRGGCSYAVSFWVPILVSLSNTISSLLLIEKKKDWMGVIARCCWPEGPNT